MRRSRYFLGALGGLAVIGSSIAGLHAVQMGGPLAHASINGSFPANCAAMANTTVCGLPPPDDDGTTTAGSQYRDGVYTVAGPYETPGGSEILGVTVTLTDDVVRAATVEVEATSPTARQFQDQFASRYSSEVVARDLSSVRVSRVAGASLTSVGFNRAVAEIKAAAHG